MKLVSWIHINLMNEVLLPSTNINLPLENEPFVYGPWLTVNRECSAPAGPVRFRIFLFPIHDVNPIYHQLDSGIVSALNILSA